MKHTIKHPDGTTYDLTIEEMQSPLLIEQLQIDASWSVKKNDKWISLNAFLWEQNQKLAQEPSKKNSQNYSEKESEQIRSKVDNMLQADAPWSPASIFGLGIRFIGLFLLGKGLLLVTSIIMGLIGYSSAGYSTLQRSGALFIESSSMKPPHFINILAAIFITVIGIYLLRKPHGLVSLAFSEND